MTKTMERSFSNLDNQSAVALLRQASVDRQQQAGSIEQSKIESILSGKHDNQIGFEDAKYALMNAEQVWPKALEQT